jgi:hypothetical protein
MGNRYAKTGNAVEEKESAAAKTSIAELLNG